jgi:hypothetical protein
MPEIGTHQREGTDIRRRADPRPRGWEPRPDETVVPSCVLSVSERDRFVRLLALVSPPPRWAFEHRHTPLLCAIGILDPPDEAYARAVLAGGFRDGETRTRTGDTTIFSRGLRSLQLRLKSCISLVFTSLLSD